MLVDPNRIDAAIDQLRQAASTLNEVLQRQRSGNNFDMAWASASIIVGQSVDTLIACLNEGFGDRSEPVTYAELLQSAREWALERIEEDPYPDREDIVDRAVKNVAVRVQRNQALIEVFMSKPELANVECDDEWWNPHPSQIMWEAIRLQLIKDMQDLIDEVAA